MEFITDKPHIGNRLHSKLYRNAVMKLMHRQESPTVWFSKRFVNRRIFGKKQQEKFIRRLGHSEYSIDVFGYSLNRKYRWEQFADTKDLMMHDSLRMPEIFQLEGVDYYDTYRSNFVTNFYQQICGDKIVRCTNKEKRFGRGIPTKHKVIAPGESVSASERQDFYAEAAPRPVIQYCMVKPHPNLRVYSGRLTHYYKREIIAFREHGIDGDDDYSDYKFFESEVEFSMEKDVLDDVPSIYDAPKEFRLNLTDVLRVKKKRDSSRRRKHPKWEVINDITDNAEDDFEIVKSSDIAMAAEKLTDNEGHSADDKTVATCSGSSACVKCGKTFHFPLRCTDYAIWAEKFDQQAKLNAFRNNPTKKCQCGDYLCNRSNRDKSDFNCHKCQATYCWQTGVTKATGHYILGRTHFRLKCRQCPNLVIFDNESGVTCKVCHTFWERIYNNNFHGSRRTCLLKLDSNNIIASYYERYSTWAHNERLNRTVPFSIPKECGLDADHAKLLLHLRLKALHLIEFGFAWLYMSRGRDFKKFKSTKTMLEKVYEKLVGLYVSLKRKKRVQTDAIVNLNSLVEGAFDRSSRKRVNLL